MGALEDQQPVEVLKDGFDVVQLQECVRRQAAEFWL